MVNINIIHGNSTAATSYESSRRVVGRGSVNEAELAPESSSGVAGGSHEPYERLNTPPGQFLAADSDTFVPGTARVPAVFCSILSDKMEQNTWNTKLGTRTPPQEPRSEEFC